MLHKELSNQVINVFYEVYNTLGYGFLEKVYENAMVIELKKRGLACKQQQRIEVTYKGERVGLYYADLCVEDKIILELKAAEAMHSAHKAQLINYLRATDIELGFVLNFGKSPEFARKVYSNSLLNIR